MAIIGKIRQRTGLLLGTICVALVMFILMDYFQNKGRGGESKSVGKIGGSSIDAQDFSQKVDDYVNRIKLINPNLPLNDETNSAIRDEVWNNLVVDRLLKRNLDKMGVNVSDEEIADGLKGQEPHPLAQRIFVDPQTQQYDRNIVTQVISKLDEQDEQTKKTVQMVETIIDEDRLKTKYASLISKGFNIPTFYLNEGIKANASSAKGTVYALPYSSIADKDVKVSDDEILKYMEAHKSKFERKEETRNIEYISFNVVPTKSDSIIALGNITTKYNEFVAATANDTVFRKRFTTRKLDDAYYTAQDFQPKQGDNTPPRQNVEQLFALPAGTITAPYIESGNYVVTKILGKRMLSDSVRASHILLKIEGNTKADYDKVNAKADSLLALAKSGKIPFPQLAFDNSSDEGSKQQGGNLGFFPRGAMVKPFNDKVFFEMNLGEFAKVESNFGIHIIWLTGINPTTPAIKFADVVVEINASKETNDAVYKKANDFYLKSTTSADFTKNTKKMSVLKANELKANDVKIPSVTEGREIIRWAFEQKKTGEVYFIDKSDQIIVAHLVSINPKGMPKVEDVKASVESLVKDQKKGEMLVDKLNKAGANLEGIAGIIKKDSVDFQFSNDNFQDFGREPKLAGLGMATKAGAKSKAIAGERNAFIVKIDTQTPADTKSMPLDFVRMQMMYGYSQKFQFQNIIESIKKGANIKDERHTIF
ncbi:MAG: SurA N-terminal domain-containing protein [Chitinophagales bacterium]|nr:SurA N-terminal domain-containing protein [Chitinophagales bacterium]